MLHCCIVCEVSIDTLLATVSQSLSHGFALAGSLFVPERLPLVRNMELPEVVRHLLSLFVVICHFCLCLLVSLKCEL